MGRKSIADQRRTEIIQAFYNVVINEGFKASSIRKVAQEAGVLPSTLHHYFKDRSEMIAETVAFYTDQIIKGFAPPDTFGQNTDEDLKLGLDYIFGPAMINPEMTGFFLECCAEARHHPKVRSSLARLFERFRENILTHLGELPVFKQLTPLQQKTLSSIVIALHEGIELQWFADPESVSLADACGITRWLLENIHPYFRDK